MAITSASTYAEVLAQYNDNLDWDGNAVKAALALAAVRWLLVNRAQQNQISGRTTNYESLEMEKKKLEEYIAIASTGRKISTFTRGIPLT
jgi:hypothetical protein